MKLRVFGLLGLAAVAAVAISMLPDLARYLKIREM
jgi:hypothetical protein